VKLAAYARWRGGVILFAVMLLLMGMLWATAAELGWNRDRGLWVGPLRWSSTLRSRLSWCG